MNDLSKNSEHQQAVENQMTNFNAKKSLDGIKENISKTANIGSIVTFNLLEHQTNESEIYTLKLVDHIKYYKDEVSLDSPIGKNIYKTHIGDTVTYTLMSNKFTATIINIESSV